MCKSPASWCQDRADHWRRTTLPNTAYNVTMSPACAEAAGFGEKAPVRAGPAATGGRTDIE